MLINCNSCHKKFMVPDSAITESGRLVQCGTCGNKWTQYPVREQKLNQPKIVKESNQQVKKSKTKKIIKKRRLSKIDRYSQEYLEKKHGIKIIEKKSKEIKKAKNKFNDKEEKSKRTSFGFYGSLVLFVIFITTIFGIINLTKGIMINIYPQSEIYIDYLYEAIEILNTIIFQLLNSF